MYLIVILFYHQLLCKSCNIINRQLHINANLKPFIIIGLGTSRTGKLMNHPIFLRTLRSQNIYKISDKLKAFNIQPLENRKIILKQYECKKTLKSAPSKSPHQPYHLSTITDGPFIFFQTKQPTTQKLSTFTLAETQFLQKHFLNSLFSEIKEVSSHEYLVSGYRWDGFVIEIMPISEDSFFFIITNQMISPLVKRHEARELQFKIKQGFQEFLSRIISQRTANQLIQLYLQQIKKLVQNHPELLTDTEETEKIVNFNLIKYAKISEVIHQEAKTKITGEKRDKTHSTMEIQK